MKLEVVLVATADEEQLGRTKVVNGKIHMYVPHLMIIAMETMLSLDALGMPSPVEIRSEVEAVERILVDDDTEGDA